ncbi:MAG: hypothetical protein RLZZ09_1993 [Pseudomonadota bacterium]
MCHFGFFSARFTAQALRRSREAHARGTQGSPKTSFQVFIWALVLQAIAGSGSLGHHLRMLAAVKLSDSAAIQRKAGLNWAFFESLFQSVFAPLADRKKHPDCFYRGHLLLGLDGTQFSLRNTLSVKSLARKRPGNQHGVKAAFLKWTGAVLVELGTHQPLGAGCMRERPGPAEGELTIAKRALPGVPRNSATLILADRLYGCGRFARDVAQACGPKCRLLMRVKNQLKAKVLRVLKDGSTLVKVNVYTPGGANRDGTETLREIRGRIWRKTPSSSSATPSAKAPRKTATALEIRLWTTLLDETLYPAEDLLRLYSQRWEHELFYRELKQHLSRDSLLSSESAAAAEVEFGALLIAASLIAQQRLEAALAVGLPPLRLSLLKIKHGLEMLVGVLSMAGDLLGESERGQIMGRVLKTIGQQAIIPARRQRSCPRGLCRPISDWPRIKSRCDEPGQWICEVLRA